MSSYLVFGLGCAIGVSQVWSSVHPGVWEDG